MEVNRLNWPSVPSVSGAKGDCRLGGELVKLAFTSFLIVPLVVERERKIDVGDGKMIFFPLFSPVPFTVSGLMEFPAH